MRPGPPPERCQMPERSGCTVCACAIGTTHSTTHQARSTRNRGIIALGACKVDFLTVWQSNFPSKHCRAAVPRRIASERDLIARIERLLVPLEGPIEIEHAAKFARPDFDRSRLRLDLDPQSRVRV